MYYVILKNAVFYHGKSHSVSFHYVAGYYTCSRYFMLYILDRVCTVFLSCVLKYMGLYHTSRYGGMTRVSTSSALHCIGRNTEDAEM